MPMKRSLRWRLAWSFTLLSIFAVLAQAIALFVGAEEQEEDMIDEVVNAALDNYLHQAGNQPVPDIAAASANMKLYRLPPGVPPPTLPLEFARLSAGNHEWFIGDVEYHVGVRDVDGERVYLMYDATEHEARLDQLKWKLLVGLLVLSLISLSLGYWLAGRMLVQLQQVIQRLHGDEPGPFDQPGLDLEVSQLAGALDVYRGRNRELLAREREFTANVSHELRTPLTRLRTSAELLADDDKLPPRCKERAGRIIDAADTMETRLRGLLFLARELTPAVQRPLELKKYVEASIAPLRPACEAAGIAIEIDVPQALQIAGDGALLQLLLDNLIGNAVRYTRQGRIAIVADRASMTISDTGVGIPAEHLAHVFDRHYRASEHPDGSGLGLSIVRRVCDAHRWECGITSVADAGTPGQGTRVTVRFIG
jgi:signal transduction histidine kinase